MLRSYAVAQRIWLYSILLLIESAPPSPPAPSDTESAEDARTTIIRILEALEENEGEGYYSIRQSSVDAGMPKAAAELERFAAARVERANADIKWWEDHCKDWEKSRDEIEARLDRFRREVDAYGRAHGLDTIIGDVDAALEAEKEDAKWNVKYAEIMNLLQATATERVRRVVTYAMLGLASTPAASKAGFARVADRFMVLRRRNAIDAIRRSK